MFDFLPDHCDDVPEVGAPFLIPLAVRARESGNVADLQAGVRALLHDGGAGIHATNLRHRFGSPQYPSAIAPGRRGSP